MFISLKWKSILLVSLILVSLSAFFTYLNNLELKRLFTEQRAVLHIQHQNEIKGLLQQSYNNLLQLSDILSLKSSIHSQQEHYQKSEIINKLNQQWSYIQIIWGLESITLYDHQGILINSWGELDLQFGKHSAEQVASFGYPISELYCNNSCQQLVTTPIMATSNQPNILQIKTSLADTLRTFNEITQSNIGIITDKLTNKASDEKHIEPWKKSLKAMTHIDQMQVLIREIAKKHSFQAIKSNRLIFSNAGKYYEIDIFSVDKLKPNIAHFIIIDEVTDYVLQIKNASKSHLRGALLAILTSCIIIISALWQPITRLRKQSTLLPLLCQGKFQYVRKQLDQNSYHRWFKDEIDILYDTEIKVSSQLEAMQKQIQQDNDKLHKLAMYDRLTGLANRLNLIEHINQALKNIKPDQKIFAIMFLDLDNFKRINDSLGHNYGDKLLKIVAKRLTYCVKSGDIVARLGGDEFCILIHEIKQKSMAEKISGNLLRALNKPIHIESTELIVSTSIGIVTAPDDGDTTEKLLQNADIAMYKAKSQGKNKSQSFSNEMNKAAIEKMSLETELHQAIAEEQFILYYQPLIDLSTGKIISAEALIRWQHPTKGILGPNCFIPFLEESGFIVPLGKWILSTACQAAQNWSDKNLEPINISVNLSSRQFLDPNLFSTIKKILIDTNLDTHRLTLEITESMILDELDDKNKLLKKLKELGLSVAIDDFGTGYSSLSYLKTLTLDILKIDRSFISDIPNKRGNTEIVAAIIAMAHKLNLKVVAEGIETLPQKEFLQENNCELGQGYLFSKPLPEKEFMVFLQNSSVTSLQWIGRKSNYFDASSSQN